MATYDYAQLEELWIGAGGPRTMAPLMAAIAMAESSGNSQAKNASGASGLWQILGNPFPGDVWDPQTNARMAVAKWREQGLTAWTTYTSGDYKRFLKAGVKPGGGGGAPVPAQTTAAQGGGGGGGFWTMWNVVPGTGIPIGWVAGAASSTTDIATALGEIQHDASEFLGWIAWLFVPSHWIRIICFLLGVPLVGLGVVTMTKGSIYGPAQPVVQVAQGQGAPVPSGGGSIAPAVGIAEVTFGAVLLFIAFHNLPENVQNFPQLLAYVQSGAGTAAASKVRPQVAVD